MKQSSILIVDDKAAGRLTLEGLLTPEGYQLSFAEDGLQALAVAAELIPDLIILDVMMPGMDGFEVCRHLRANPVLAEVPVILLTSLDDRESRLKGIESGADDFIQKPFDKIELRARLRTILRLNRYRQLLRERAKFERLVESLPNGILIINADGIIELTNSAFAKLIGRNSSEIIGQSFSQMVVPACQAELLNYFKLVTSDAKFAGQLETEIIRGNGQQFPAELDIASFEWREQPAIQCMVRDISERKKLNEQFLRAQRLENIGALASGIAHDLNNVLTPILLSTQILQKRVQDERSQQILSTLIMTAQRGADLVKQVLSFGRGLESAAGMLQPKHLVLEIEKIARQTFPRTIEISADVASDLWMISADATQLHQVLMNLTVNARDAMPQGGKLSISAKNFYIDQSYARMNSEAKVGPYVVIGVSDSGCGIPPDLQEQIFEPFFTTKSSDRGTGLGLSTVQTIVRSHQGFIKVYSEPAKGSRFDIYWPALTTSETKQAEHQFQHLPTGNDELVLVIDDEASIREITKATLESYGYRVITASDGAEAIAIYVQQRNEISVVITDMMMPIMDGATTIRALRKINPAVTVIAVSGLISPERANEITLNGIETLLSKPYTTEELLTALATTLKRPVAQ